MELEDNDMSSQHMSVRQATIYTLSMFGGIAFFGFASDLFYKFLVRHLPEPVAYGLKVLLFVVDLQLLYLFISKKVLPEAIPKLNLRSYVLQGIPLSIMLIALMVMLHALL